MDLILEKQDVFKVALSDWKTKWVLQYSHQSTGKAFTLFLQAQKAYEGKYNVTVESRASTHSRVSAQEARQTPGNAHSWVSAQACFLSFYMASALVFRQLPWESVFAVTRGPLFLHH